MLQTLKRLRKLLSVPLQWLVILAMAVMVLDVLWGVLGNALAPVANAETGAVESAPVYEWLKLHIGFDWVSELATCLLVWIGLLGSCVAYERKAHLGVDVLTSRLAPETRKLSELFVHLLVGTFAAVALLYGGFEAFREAYFPPAGLSAVQLADFKPEVMTQLQIPKAIGITLAVPIAGVVFTLLALENFLETLLSPPTELTDPSETTEVSHG